MVHLHRNSFSAGFPNQVGCLFNRFGTVQLGRVRPGGPAGAVDCGSGRAKFDRDAAARAARGPRYQCHFTL
jgi:hypothetical protein